VQVAAAEALKVLAEKRFKEELVLRLGMSGCFFVFDTKSGCKNRIPLVILYFGRKPALAVQFVEIICNLFFGCKLSIWQLSTCHNAAGTMHLSYLSLGQGIV
jgi:hypothetical protein